MRAVIGALLAGIGIVSVAWSVIWVLVDKRSSEAAWPLVIGLTCILVGVGIGGD